MRRLPILLLLMLPVLAFGQAVSDGDDSVTLRTADGTNFLSGARSTNASGQVIAYQLAGIGELNFGAAPKLSGMNSTKCPASRSSAVSDSDCYSSAIPLGAANALVIWVEGESDASTVTLEIILADVNNTDSISIQLAAQDFLTSMARNATYSPTEGDGLDGCSTACYVISTPYIAPTLGAATATLFAYGTTNENNEVSVWAAPIIGYAPH